ncbi:hypothetical protein [Streptomyces orinoci]|uniref:Uncharacterized protein n=1 Tax=Streptomyces orinoci TaxID=67339 RepID=A0ABV3JRP4_STRON|nr:hypothetical protein [Streptomyces orinoci]
MSVVHIPRRVQEFGHGQELAEVIPLHGEVRPARARRPWLGYLLLGSGLLLLPWLSLLAAGLTGPANTPEAWVGLDLLEALALVTTGLLIIHRDPRQILAAAATAPLLVVDAWFDVVTAAPGTDLISAVVLACCAELPMAAVCGAVAVRGFARRG